MSRSTPHPADASRARCQIAPGADHRHKAEHLLEQLAGLLRQDKLTREVFQARRRRAIARRSIAKRLIADPSDGAPV